MGNENKNNTYEEKKKVIPPNNFFRIKFINSKYHYQKNIISRTEDNLHLSEEKKREMRRKRF
ncbi:hypothetical protein, partial [Plasmodium yoelii yoelii]